VAPVRFPISEELIDTVALCRAVLQPHVDEQKQQLRLERELDSHIRGNDT